MKPRGSTWLWALLVFAWASVPSAGDEPPRRPDSDVVARQGMVVAVCPLAADAGLEVLKQGGNAVDATVATAMVLAVTWPEAGNIGGGGFMLVHPGAGKPPVVVDYRETAPQAATRDMFDGPGEPSQYKLVGVPGTVAGLELAHARYGTKPWRELVMPAARLAKEGFTVDAALAESLNGGLKKSDAFAEFRRVFGKPMGEPWQPDDRLVLGELAETLEVIANHGSAGFYSGATAQRIVAEMKTADGLISLEDLQNYRAVVREPVRGTFRGYQILGPPPPSSGGIALVEMLNIIENFSLESEGRYSPQTLHVITEAMRRAYYDRARYLGDPDFAEIPTKLLSKSYARELAAQIDLNHATSSRALASDIPISEEGPQTTHFSVVDGRGMAVANTYTLEQAFGSRIVVRGGGFLLNNEMGDFNRQAGVTTEKGRIGTPPNLVAPGKRMLSSMTPLIVTTPQGQPVLVTGSPGGRTIINTVTCVALNVLEFKMSPAEAVAAPRMHHAWFPDRIQAEPGLFEHHADALDALRALGHKIDPKPRVQGDAHTIWIDRAQGTLHGVPDLRRRGAARGF